MWLQTEGAPRCQTRLLCCRGPACEGQTARRDKSSFILLRAPPILRVPLSRLLPPACPTYTLACFFQKLRSCSRGSPYEPPRVIPLDQDERMFPFPPIKVGSFHRPPMLNVKGALLDDLPYNSYRSHLVRT